MSKKLFHEALKSLPVMEAISSTSSADVQKASGLLFGLIGEESALSPKEEKADSAPLSDQHDDDPLSVFMEIMTEKTDEQATEIDGLRIQMLELEKSVKNSNKGPEVSDKHKEYVAGVVNDNVTSMLATFNGNVSALNRRISELEQEVKFLKLARGPKKDDTDDVIDDNETLFSQPAPNVDILDDPIPMQSDIMSPFATISPHIPRMSKGKDRENVTAPSVATAKDGSKNKMSKAREMLLARRKKRDGGTEETK